METRISRVDFEENRRVIVVSDIHGNLGLFKKVLQKAGYSPIKDILVINGNMIERGPHSLQTLRYISQLSDDGDVYVTMGNSEAIQLVFLSDETSIGNDKIFRYIVSRRITGRSCLLSEMFYEMDYPVDSAKDVERGREELKRRYMPEIMFMQSLPTIIETRNFIFVHGGIPNDDIDSFEHTDAMQYLKRDAFLEHCDFEFPKYVITGGWPCNLYNSKIQSQRPIIDRTRKIVAMAGGAGYKFDGQVNALIINNQNKADFGFVSEDGFQEAIALSPQKPSVDSINIRRTSNLVKILELGNEFSYIQHRVTGKKLYMYNRYLHSEDEYTTCEDYTDYELDVKAGDKLNILFETSRGYYCKKNGVTGWYKGTIELLPREEIITKEDLLSMHQSTQVVMVDTKLSYNQNLKKVIEQEEQAKKDEKALIDNINTALMEKFDPENVQIDIPLDEDEEQIQNITIQEPVGDQNQINEDLSTKEDDSISIISIDTHEDDDNNENLELDDTANQETNTDITNESDLETTESTNEDTQEEKNIVDDNENQENVDDLTEQYSEITDDSNNQIDEDITDSSVKESEYVETFENQEENTSIQENTSEIIFDDGGMVIDNEQSNKEQQFETENDGSLNDTSDYNGQEDEETIVETSNGEINYENVDETSNDEIDDENVEELSNDEKIDKNTNIEQTPDTSTTTQTFTYDSPSNEDINDDSATDDSDEQENSNDEESNLDDEEVEISPDEYLTDEPLEQPQNNYNNNNKNFFFFKKKKKKKKKR